jgi:hypothetical protein
VLGRDRQLVAAGGERVGAELAGEANRVRSELASTAQGSGAGGELARRRVLVVAVSGTHLPFTLRPVAVRVNVKVTVAGVLSV